MNKTVFAFLILSVLGFRATGQKYMTKTGHIKFYSEAPAEKIEAHNRQVNCALDASSGNIVFKILIKSFEFEKALMQEHFNENYLESDKYPNATFTGKVDNLNEIDFSKDGEYKTHTSGTMTIHGVSKEVKIDGVFTIKGNALSGKSVFMIAVKDYNIKIPNTVVNNIAEEVQVTVDLSLTKMQ